VGIDPGPETSGVCVWDTEKQVIRAMNSECDNNIIGETTEFQGVVDKYIIEDVKSYGMPVGESVFATCKAIGRLQERLGNTVMAYKSDIQLHFCNTTKAKGTNIKRVLLDRFGEKGTKKKKGITYGLKDHAWSAFALTIYYQDVYIFGDKKNAQINNRK